MYSEKDFERYGHYPLEEIECLIGDLDNILKQAYKKKNKRKTDILLQIAKEDIEWHLAQIIEALEPLNVPKLTKKDYKILSDID